LATEPAIRTLTRRDGLTLAREAIWDIANRLAALERSSLPAEVVVEIFDNWDARLVAAGRLLPDFVLNEAVAHALTELARAAHGVDDPEELVEWIDLLPRNALQLVDVTPWVYRSWHAQRRQASSLSNTVSDATGQAWGSRTGHFRRRVAVA
jgi:hypothetical protein